MAKVQETIITVERKLIALSAKLASVPVTPAQATVLSFAPAVVQAPGLVQVTEAEVKAMLEALPEVNVMLLARAFMSQDVNAQGLSPQQLYSVSPLFWSHAGEQANQIAYVICPDGKMRASGLLSALVRASSGFSDHLNQLVGKQAGGVQLIKPTTKAPSLPKAVFNTAGSNGALAVAMLAGFTDVASLPAVAVKAAKASNAAPDLDPFADLSDWL